MKMYERHLVAPELQGLGDDLLTRFQETESLLLRWVGRGRGAGASPGTAGLHGGWVVVRGRGWAGGADSQRTGVKH